MRELRVQVVTVHGNVDSEAQAYARHKIGQLAKLAPGPVLLARVKLQRAPDPALERPALAQATLDVNGRVVRAHVAARQLDEAVDLLEARLRDRLQHLHSHLRARRPDADLTVGLLVRPQEDGEQVATVTMPDQPSLGVDHRQVMDPLRCSSRAAVGTGTSGPMTAWADHDVKEYPDAGHAFLHHPEGEPGVVVNVMARFTHAGYHEPSARGAWQRICESVGAVRRDRCQAWTSVSRHDPTTDPARSFLALVTSCLPRAGVGLTHRFWPDTAASRCSSTAISRDRSGRCPWTRVPSR